MAGNGSSPIITRENISDSVYSWIKKAIINVSHEGKSNVAVDVQIIDALSRNKPQEVSEAIRLHLQDVVTTLSRNSSDLLDVESPEDK
ncbi:MAG: hypothetical protein LBG57_00075 [Treponema sp.]|nr:hypothetical protein [Treponema sp.]